MKSKTAQAKSIDYIINLFKTIFDLYHKNIITQKQYVTLYNNIVSHL